MGEGGVDVERVAPSIWGVAGWGGAFMVGSATSLIHGCHSSVWVELGNLDAKLG